MRRRAGTPERRAVFLDRDGTINRDVDLLKRPEELELLEGAAEAVRRLNHAGYLAVVITNQSVVARGGVTLEGSIGYTLGSSISWASTRRISIVSTPVRTIRTLESQVQSTEFTVICDCRKPATGSIDAACRDMAIERRESWFVGDTTSDMEAGRRANLRTILVQTGYAGRDGKFPFDPDYVVADLAAAVSWILDSHPSLLRQMTPVAAAATHARLVVIGGVARGGQSSAAQVLKESMAVAWAHGAHHPTRLMAEAVGRGTRGNGCDGAIRCRGHAHNRRPTRRPNRANCARLACVRPHDSSNASAPPPSPHQSNGSADCRRRSGTPG